MTVAETPGKDGKLREQEPRSRHRNQLPSFFASTALVRWYPFPPLPLPQSSSKSCHRKLLKAQSEYVSLHPEAFRIKCRFLSFVFKALHVLCQMYCSIFISKCSLLALPLNRSTTFISEFYCAISSAQKAVKYGFGVRNISI